MTTPTAPTATPAAAPATAHRSRILSAFRLQFIVRQMVWVPLVVFVVSWLIALGIAVWLRSILDQGVNAGSPIYTGASQAAIWTVAFMAAYAASHTFPFGLALSYSRRVYMAGTALAFLAVSAGFGLLFGIGAALEQATDGFGIHAYNFALPYLMQNGAVGAGVFATLVCLVVMLVGFVSAMLYKRVSVMQLWLIILGVVVVLAAILLLVIQNDALPTLWQWIVEQTPLSLSAWLVAAAAALTALGYGLIRRATP